LKGIQPPSGFLIVSDARESCRRISCAVFFKPALKMQTQIFSTRRSHKDVICSTFKGREEKRKTAY
jgi:hypothetical protein